MYWMSERTVTKCSLASDLSIVGLWNRKLLKPEGGREGDRDLKGGVREGGRVSFPRATWRCFPATILCWACWHRVLAGSVDPGSCCQLHDCLASLFLTSPSFLHAHSLSNPCSCGTVLSQQGKVLQAFFYHILHLFYHNTRRKLVDGWCISPLMLDMCGAGDSKHRFAISFTYYITTGKVEGDAVLWKFKNKFPFPFLCPQQEEEVCTRGRCISVIRTQDGTPASYH